MPRAGESSLTVSLRSSLDLDQDNFAIAQKRNARDTCAYLGCRQEYRSAGPHRGFTYVQGKIYCGKHVDEMTEALPEIPVVEAPGLLDL